MKFLGLKKNLTRYLQMSMGIVGSRLKKHSNPYCGGAEALTSLLLPHRSLRICSVVAPRHRIRRARNLKCRNFSTGS
jgi:hypothetical protein